MTTLFDRTEKIAILTGANTGLGQAMTIGLAEAGAVIPVDGGFTAMTI